MEDIDVLDGKNNLNFCCLYGVFTILVYLENKSILSTTCLHVDNVFKGYYVFVFTKAKFEVNRDIHVYPS